MGKKYLSLRTVTLPHSAFMNACSLPRGRNSCHPKNSCDLKTSQRLYINSCLCFSPSNIKEKSSALNQARLVLYFYPNISQNKYPSGNSFGMQLNSLANFFPPNMDVIMDNTVCSCCNHCDRRTAFAQ